MKRKSVQPVAESSESEHNQSEEEAEENNSETENLQASDEAGPSSKPDPPIKPAKKKKKGIIYLSTIPKHMTVSIARDLFNQYAVVGRMFFQPANKFGDGGK